MVHNSDPRTGVLNSRITTEHVNIPIHYPYPHNQRTVTLVASVHVCTVCDGVHCLLQHIYISGMISQSTRACPMAYFPGVFPSEFSKYVGVQEVDKLRKGVLT